jgi:hypothetical protein
MLRQFAIAFGIEDEEEPTHGIDEGDARLARDLEAAGLL